MNLKTMLHGLPAGLLIIGFMIGLFNRVLGFWLVYSSVMMFIGRLTYFNEIKKTDTKIEEDE